MPSDIDVRLKILVYSETSGTSGSYLSSTVESWCVNVLKLVDYFKTNKLRFRIHWPWRLVEYEALNPSLTIKVDW